MAKNAAYYTKKLAHLGKVVLRDNSLKGGENALIVIAGAIFATGIATGIVIGKVTQK